MGHLTWKFNSIMTALRVVPRDMESRLRLLKSRSKVCRPRFARTRRRMCLLHERSKRLTVNRLLRGRLLKASLRYYFRSVLSLEWHPYITMLQRFFSSTISVSSLRDV